MNPTAYDRVFTITRGNDVKVPIKLSLFVALLDGTLTVDQRQGVLDALCNRLEGKDPN